MKCPMCGGPMVQKRGRVGTKQTRRYYFRCIMCGKIHVPRDENDLTPV